MSSSSAAPEVTVEALLAELASYKKIERKWRRRLQSKGAPADLTLKELYEGSVKADDAGADSRHKMRVEMGKLDSKRYKLKKANAALVAENKTLKEECDLLAAKYKEIVAKYNTGVSTSDAIVTSVTIVSLAVLTYYAFKGCK